MTKESYLKRFLIINGPKTFDPIVTFACIKPIYAFVIPYITSISILAQFVVRSMPHSHTKFNEAGFYFIAFNAIYIA